METREAACCCGRLRVAADSDPVRISMCHCQACQRRTGSAFGMQARFPEERVRIEGRHTAYDRPSDFGEARTFHFCPDCGSTVFFTSADRPGLIAVAIGAVADRDFPQPTVSVYESRMHPWVALPEGMEHEEF